MPEVKTLSGDMERKLLHQDLLKERDSDEDGGAKTRVEFDSDFSYEEEEENYVEEPDPNEGKENWSEILTKQRKKHNTGVKGVRADYEEAKRIVRRRNETKKLRDMEAFKQQAYGSTMTGESVSINSQAKREKGFVPKYDADAEDDDSDSDDEFLAQYKQQRMAQLNSINQLPQFGHVIPVGKFEFLDETDQADPRTYVITHIYEDYLGACKRMNTVLEEFARKHRHIKVLKLVATEASQTLSHRALPAFLVYKDKELVNDSSVGVNENVFGTEDFNLSEVEWFFSSHYGIQLVGVDISQSEMRMKGTELDESSTKWQSSQQQTLGRVNLLGSRISKTLNLGDSDDDDW